MLNVADCRRDAWLGWRIGQGAVDRNPHVEGIGIALPIVGSFDWQAPDWDVPVSILMALVAYATAPWCMRAMLERRWRAWPAMLFQGLARRLLRRLLGGRSRSI
jgi:hypothetical protein